jgi:hypothetical protein
VVEGALIGGVEAGDGFGDFAVGVGDGFQDAFAEILGLVGVPEFEGFVFAGGGAGRDGGAAARAGIEGDIGFDGGIAAGIDDLSGVDAGDFGGHAGAGSSVRLN